MIQRQQRNAAVMLTRQPKAKPGICKNVMNVVLMLRSKNVFLKVFRVMSRFAEKALCLNKKNAVPRVAIGQQATAPLMQKNKLMATKKNIKNNRICAQSIIELAVLGAIFFGLLGTLIQVTASYSDAQATQLQAMREALRLSAKEGMEENEYIKTKHRSNASVLWIEDKPAIAGGEKYGSSSYTPSVSSGSGTFTNNLNYIADYGDMTALPLMDVYINGQHFSFTTAAYKEFPPPGDSYLEKKGNVYKWKDSYCGDYGARKCLHYPIPTTFNGGGVANPWYLWDPATPPSGERQLVFWTKIPWTDKRFCYGQNDPPDHYCRNISFEPYGFWARWVLDPVNAPGRIIPEGDRRKMQWQWYPIIAQELGCNDGTGDHTHHINPIGLGFFRNNGDDSKAPGPQIYVDVDFDGHEENIMQMEEWGIYDPNGVAQECRRHFQYRWTDTKESLAAPWLLPCYGAAKDPGCPDKESLCDSQRDGALSNEGYKISKVWVMDFEDGDIAMSYSTVDELQDKPKPGFVEGSTKVVTHTKGDLNIAQKAQGSLADNISVQKQDSTITIERQIQLSNNTGRLDPRNPRCCTVHPTNCNPTLDACGLPDPAGSVACDTTDITQGREESCCYKENRHLSTCLDTKAKILYVRTEIEKKAGHKYKTQQSTKGFP